MTERYDRQEVNSRHAVAFSKPKAKQDLYYYDFDVKEWRQVIPQDNLPYGLCSYRFTDDTEERSVVTCHDSYRLSTDPDKEPNHEHLEQERVWRDSIVREGAEMEYTPSSGETQRAKVLWCKADIIPGVVVSGPRECPNINSFGYIYKESRCFTKTGTHLPIITQEQLDEEQRERAKAKKRYEEFQDHVWELKDKLPYISGKEFARGSIGMVGQVVVYDTRGWWRYTVRKRPKEITAEQLREWATEKGEDKILQQLDEGSISASQLCIYAELTFAKDFDALFVRAEQSVPQEWKKSPYVTYTTAEAEERARKEWEPSCTLGSTKDSQFLFDIQVHNATYAYMHCGDRDDHNQWHRRFEMVKVGEVWTFPEVTFDNPLHQAVSGSTYYFYTDGSHITYSAGWRCYEVNQIMNSLRNGWAVSELQDRVLLNGHLWAPSMSWPNADTVSVDRPTREEVEEKDRNSARWVQMS